MMPRRRRVSGRIPRAVALVALVGLLVAACSSPVSLDEYIDTMESASSAYVTEAQERSFQYQSTVEDGVRDLVADESADPLSEAAELVRTETVRYLAYLGDAMSRYRDAIVEAAPPAEIAEAHEAFGSAVAAVVDGVPATRAAVEAAETLDGIQQSLGASQLADGQPRWTATCRALEQAVRDQGRGIDLRCVEDATP